MSRAGDEKKYRSKTRRCRRLIGETRVDRSVREHSAVASAVRIVSAEWDEPADDCWLDLGGRVHRWR